MRPRLPTTRTTAVLLAGLVQLGCGDLASAPKDGGSTVPDAGTESPDAGSPLPSLVVAVDVSAPQGPVRDVFGVNKAPTLQLRTGGAVDATKLYDAFAVSQVRLHDVGIDPCTIYKDATVRDLSVSPPRVVVGCTFPDIVKRRSWTVNDASKVDDPSNYDFAKTDVLLAAAAKSGGKIYLRIGANDYGGPNDTGDVDSFARVSINIYRHVIGRFKSAGISYDPVFVEVGNEPDGAFWRGDRADFISAYNLMVDGVRTAASEAGKTVKVGGAGFTDTVLDAMTRTDNVAHGFVAGVTPARLDFFSAHHYDDCSAATLPSAAAALSALRAKLSSEGIPTVPLHLTEWNIGLGNKCAAGDFTSAQSQSFASGMLTLMQDGALDVSAAHFYSGMPPMSLFQSGASVSEGLRITPSAWALRAHAGLRGGTLVKAEVCNGTEPCVSGAAGAGAPLVAVAGRRADGSHRVLVTNDSDTARPFALRVSGLPAGTASATLRYPPSTEVTVEGTVTGNVFVPSDASVTAALAKETSSTVSFPVSGAAGAVPLTLPARSVLAVDLP
ncbi:MAG: Beta-xylosidase [Pseudomonadota bacterium]|jgi:hypothetical protein